MRHDLKIQPCYLIHILEDKKTFTVRKNDRDFQIGDTIRWLPLDDENYNAYDVVSPIPDYQIDYVLTDFVGLQPNYVCLAITPIAKDRMADG